MNLKFRHLWVIPLLLLGSVQPAIALNFINNCEGQSPSAGGTWFGTCPPFDNSQTNWEGNTLPGPTDTAVLPAQYGEIYINGYPSEATVMSVQAMGGLMTDYSAYGLVLTSGSSMINGLNMGPGNITLMPGVNVTLTGSSSLWANYYGPGTMTCTGTISLSGALLWNGAIITVDGAATHNGGIMQLGDSNTELIINGSLEIGGSALDIRGGGSALVNNGTIVHNRPNREFSIGPNYEQNGSLLVSQGTLKLSGRETAFTGGSVTVQAGAILLLASNASGVHSHRFNGMYFIDGSGLVDNYQDYTVSSPLTLDVGSGTPESGTGGFRLQGTLLCEASVTNYGRFRFNNGEVSGSSIFTNKSTGWAYTRTSGSATVSGVAFDNHGNFQLGGGGLTVDGEYGEFINFGTFNILGGGVSGGGTFINISSFTGNLSGPTATSTISITFDPGRGTVHSITGRLNFSSFVVGLGSNGDLTRGTWIAEPGSRITFPETVTKISSGARVIGLQSSFPNVQLIGIGQGGELKSQEWDTLGDLFLEDGDLTAEAGGNGVSVPGTLTNTEGGAVNVEEGADLDVGQLDNGDGFDSVIPELASIVVIAKNGSAEKAIGEPATVTTPLLNNRARIAPGQQGTVGELHLVGNLVQFPSGVLDIDLGTADPDTVNDLLTIEGNANLAGEVKVRLAPSFRPSLGQEFTILTVTGAITGSFDGVDQPLGATFSLRQEPQRVVLVAETVQGVSPVPDVPGGFNLAAAYPNPFNPATTLSFELPRELPVRLAIFDVSGRKVKDLLRGDFRQAGPHSVVWNGRNEAGGLVPAGVYFYRMSAGEFTATRRMTLIK